MKIRQGFVSNSSSSSFILSVKPDKENYTIEIPIDSLGTVYKTFEEWSEENDYYEEDDSKYKEVKAIFDSGRIIIEKEIDYGGEEAFEDMISKIKDIKLLHG